MRNIKEKIEENKTKGEISNCHCSTCNRPTRHLVLQSVDQMWSKQVVRHDPYSCVDGSEHYQIVQCQGCYTISFRHLSWLSEARDVDCDGTTERLYPKRSDNRRLARGFRNLPPTLECVYRETVNCYNSKSYTLCAAGLRAIVEGLCAEQGVKDGPVEVVKKGGTKQTKRKRDLEGKISGLCEKGILTKENTDLLHEHRYLGNEAVHELAQPSPTELILAIEILEHTLEALYEIPEKAEDLRQKKQRRQRNK